MVVEGYPLLNKVAALSSGIEAENGMLGVRYELMIRTRSLSDLIFTPAFRDEQFSLY